MTYQLPRVISNLEECLLSHRVDWLVSFTEPDRESFNTLRSVCLSQNLNWLVDFSSPERTDSTDLLFSEFMSTAGLDWVVAFDHNSRVENLSYDERVKAAGASWFLPTCAAPRFTRSYSTVVIETGATWMLSMNENIQENRKAYSDQVVDTGAIWYLPMSMASVT